MKKKKLKLTKNDIEGMKKFNSNQKRIGEPVLDEDEYLLYLYGKVKIKKQKPSKLKSKDIPSWASDWRNIPSSNSDGMSEGMTRDNSWKVEICKKYPIAPPCNKSGYQLLLPSEIEGAGRKL
jgi:hypothetical protein